MVGTGGMLRHVALVVDGSVSGARGSGIGQRSGATRCGTRSRPICSRAGPTFARCRSCWVTGMSGRRCCTRTCRIAAGWGCEVHWTSARESEVPGPALSAAFALTLHYLQHNNSQRGGWRAEVMADQRSGSTQSIRSTVLCCEECLDKVMLAAIAGRLIRVRWCQAPPYD